MCNNSLITKRDIIKQTLAEIVFDHMQEGIIVLDSMMNILSLNTWAQKVTLYKDEEIAGKHYSTLFEDNKQFKTIINELKNNGTWTGEVLKKRKDGGVYFEWMNIHPVYQDNLTISNYVIVFRDMSKQKISQIERRLASKALENTSEGVMVTDQYGSILSVNPAFELVTGYTQNEIIGKNPKILQSGIHGKGFYKEMWDSINEKGNWKGEIWNKRKNGEVYPEWINISSIKDENGNVANYVSVFSDITDRKLAEEQLRKLAHFDTLTGVANRYSLTKRLNSLIETAEKYNQQLALLFLDLDRFKYINDTLGHNFGDLLLKSVSDRLKGLLNNKDMIARLGGDEFVIIIPNIKHPKEAHFIAQKIINVFAESFILENQEVFVSTSIGISLFPHDGTTEEELLRTADKAMYEAKSRGRNQFEFYHAELHQDEPVQMKLEIMLRKALEKEEFFLVYHPQLDLKSKEIVGVEALIRWNQEELGIVSPAEFIPLAEETGLIIPISEWIIKKACEDLKLIHLEGFRKIRMSINISALQFNQENFVKIIKGIFDDTNINPNFVDLELTESMIMPNASNSIDKLVKLKQLGIKISIDDFGTGYSSLSYLNRFPIDTLKIDQSFIQKLCVYHEDTSIVEAIITMSHRLNLNVVAEGVENKRQYQFLQGEKCDIIQGYYITKPLNLLDLIDFLHMWDKELEL